MTFFESYHSLGSEEGFHHKLQLPLPTHLDIPSFLNFTPANTFVMSQLDNSPAPRPTKRSRLRAPCSPLIYTSSPSEITSPLKLSHSPIRHTSPSTPRAARYSPRALSSPIMTGAKPPQGSRASRRSSPLSRTPLRTTHKVSTPLKLLSNCPQILITFFLFLLIFPHFFPRLFLIFFSNPVQKCQYFIILVMHWSEPSDGWLNYMFQSLKNAKNVYWVVNVSIKLNRNVFNHA